jgi:hypothetical protein
MESRGLKDCTHAPSEESLPRNSSRYLMSTGETWETPVKPSIRLQYYYPFPGLFTPVASRLQLRYLTLPNKESTRHGLSARADI